MFLSFFITPLPQGSGRSVLIYSSLDVLQTHVWALARSTRNGRLKFWKVFVAMSCTWGSDWVAGCEVAGRPEARAGPLDPAHAGRPVGQLVWLLACLFAPHRSHIIHFSRVFFRPQFVVFSVSQSTGPPHHISCFVCDVVYLCTSECLSPSPKCFESCRVLRGFAQGLSVLSWFICPLTNLQLTGR